MSAAVFEVRRSRSHVLMQIGFATFLVVLAAANLGNLLRHGDVERGPLFASVFFALLMAFYVWNLVNQYRDRRPQIVIGPDGLLLPNALPTPVPWSQVWNVAPPAGTFTRTRLDIDIAPEIYARMKLGQRFMGESIVRRKGLGGGLTIYTTGFEHNAVELEAAIRKFWPPADRHDDPDDDR